MSMMKKVIPSPLKMYSAHIHPGVQEYIVLMIIIKCNKPDEKI